MRKAQSSTELVVILAVSLLFLSAIVIFAYNNIKSLEEMMRVSKTREAVEKIADACERVYYAGLGSREIVMIEIPSGALPERVFISGNVINIGVGSNVSYTDINTRANVPVIGILPNTSGVHAVLVEAKNGYVRVGNVSLSLYPYFIYENTPVRTYRYRNITLANYGKSRIRVDARVTASSSNLQVRCTPTYAYLNPGQKVNMTLRFYSRQVGYYYGFANITASNGEWEKVDFVVEAV
ncbi:MAG: hypothetical protein QXP42_05610 [Candidatus Micrarchaeia archaeon]